MGGGSGGSKSLMHSGTAIVEAAAKIIEKGKEIASHVLEAAVSDIEFGHGRFVIAGTDRSISIMELAQTLAQRRRQAAGGRAAIARRHRTSATDPAPPTFPNGCHVAEVEVDPDTGVVEVVKYTCVNDFGTVVNPLIVAGQLHGGVVQGIGQALMEMTVYDGDGQLLTGSFMDYAMPRATDVPPFVLAEHPVPAKTNPLGVKGCGEAGCAGSLTSVMNAVLDALADRGIRHLDMPLTPFRIWQALHDANGVGRRALRPMTQAISVPARRFGELRVVAPVCAAHFVSHYYMIMLAPLFAFVRADYGVSYTDLALALTAFNVVSAVLQTPAGFLVDRIGARIVLIAGVALGAVAFAVAGLRQFVRRVHRHVCGRRSRQHRVPPGRLLAVSPHHSPPARIGQIFSFHTFSGILGGAVAPATLLAMQSRFGWRGAFVGAAILGLAVLALLDRAAADGSRSAGRKAPRALGRRQRRRFAEPDGGWRLLLSPPILLNLGFFILISLMGGLNSFLVVALGALYGTPDTLANVALTGLLLMNALGVLVGGVLASRTTRHATVAALGARLRRRRHRARRPDRFFLLLRSS